MALQERLILLLVHCLCILLAISPSLLLSEAQNDTLSQGQHLQGQDLLTSAGGLFQFGFFTRTFKLDCSINSEYCSNRYLGIWYTRNPEKPVWVANPENPVPDSSGVVRVDSNGILRLTYSEGQPINISCCNNNVVTTAATLLDSGNLVVRQVYSSNGSFGRVLWQSFDYPTDVFLPGMKLGVNLRTNQSWFLTSWLSDQVPAQGAFKLGVDGGGSGSSPQLVMWRRNHVYWTSGPWINGSFANASGLIQFTDILEYKFVTNENEKYFTYVYKDISTSPILAWVLEEGLIKLTSIHPDFQSFYHIPLTTWDQELKVCLKENSSNCRNGSEHYFVPTTYMPYYLRTLVEYDNTSLGLSDCHAICWNNCSCYGHGALFPNGTGCSLWEDPYDFTPADQIPGKTSYFLNTLFNQAQAPVQSPGEAPGRRPIKKDSRGSMKDWWWWWIGSLIAIIPALAMLLFGFLCHLIQNNQHFILEEEPEMHQL